MRERHVRRTREIRRFLVWGPQPPALLSGALPWVASAGSEIANPWIGRQTGPGYAKRRFNLGHGSRTLHFNRDSLRSKFQVCAHAAASAKVPGVHLRGPLSSELPKSSKLGLGQVTWP